MAKKLQIKLKKRRLYFNLFLGILWMMLAIASTFDNDPLRWSEYIYFVAGIGYLILYFYENKHQYFTIADGYIMPNKYQGIKKKVSIDEIESISKKWGEYRIHTSTDTINISSQIIDMESLEELKEFFISLDLPDEKLAL